MTDVHISVRTGWAAKKDGSKELSREWTHETIRMLRLFKSCLCFSRAVALLCLAKFQLQMQDRISTSINCYYSIFHLGVASLDLIPENKFDPRREVILPDGTSGQSIRRLTPLGHQDVAKQLVTMGEYYPYLRKLGEYLQDSRELRENFSYGPWVKIDSISGSWPDELVLFDSRPICLRRDLEISRDNPKPFPALKEIVAKRLDEASSLIDQFSVFLLEWIEKLGTHERIYMKTQLVSAFAQALYFFAPNVPKTVTEDTKAKIISLVLGLGKAYRDVVESVTQFWNLPNYIAALESDSVMRFRMRLDHIERPTRK